MAVPVVALIYLYVEPTFEAFSTLQVEPVSQKLFGQAASESVDSRGVTLYLQTQVGLLTSDRVLSEAITDPRVVNLSAIKESDDPKALIRKDMVVEILKDAYLIRVALELPDPHQAAAIVNAVVRSYLTYNSEYQRGRNSTLRANLIAELERIQKEVKEKRAELANLVNKGTVTTQKLVLNRAKTSADDDDSPQPTFTSNTEGQRQRLADEMLSKDLEISKTVSNINAMKEAIRQTAVNQNGSTKLQEEQRDQQIQDDFKKDPEVIALTDEIALAQERRDHAKSSGAQAHDPARRAAEQHYKKLMEQYDKLWDAKYKEFSARLKNTSIEVRPEQSVTDLEIKLKSLKDQKLRLIEMFDKMKVEEKTGNNDTFEATFLSRQLDTVQRDAERLNNNIKELQFKASQEDFRVSQVDQAIVAAGSHQQQTSQIRGCRADLPVAHGSWLVLLVGNQRRTSR